MNPLPPRLPSRASSTEPTPPTSGRWLDDLMRNFERLVSRAHTLHHTHVLPCVIEGRRALVHERGLEHREPAVYAWLRRFCETNDIRLQADRRSEAVPVARERRRHLAPVVALAASLLVPGMAAAVDAADLPAGSDGVRFGAVASLPVRDGGTRFLAGPHGDVSNILHIAAEARARGVPQRVSTAGLQVPDNTLNGIVTRYDYSYPADCGGERFSFFEGHDFRALGHFQGDKVVIDVLAGGGPFTAPRLWGPFDQVQNDTVDMHLVVGNGEQDSFGLMRASFSVGLVAELPAERQASYGHAYEAATRRSAKCELPALPVAPPEPVIAPLLSAGAGTPAGAGNARISAMTIGAGPADDTRANEVSAPSGRDLFGAVDHLPVRDHGKRFVATPQGEVNALVFAANPAHPDHVGEMALAQAAAIIARASGFLGSNREYLEQLAMQLRDLGIEDEYVSRLHRQITDTASG